MSLRYLLPLCSLAITVFTGSVSADSGCRNQPGDPGFPSTTEWAALNSTVDGRLLAVVPSAKYCEDLPCTETQWFSSVFRATIPGGTDFYNWEQDYDSNPPSLCLEHSTNCTQGNVPIFAINATTVQHVQTGVVFASENNLRLVIKSSGHDMLGRSTAKNSLLIWTQSLQNTTFTESFLINGENKGSAVTVGPGVPLNRVYAESKKLGKFVVGGTAASVAPAGGYVQGGGHSAFSPIYGLVADIVLQFKIVIANGTLLTVDSTTNSDLFWALRGGGAGSWGVIIEATFPTFPTFNVAKHAVGIVAPTNETTALMMSIHAKHIFDWDTVHAGQYYYLFSPAIPTNGLVDNPAVTAGLPGNGLGILTYFKDLSADEANALMKPLLDEARANNLTVVNETVVVENVNDAVFTEDNTAGVSAIAGSRFLSEKAFRENATGIGEVSRLLLEQGVQQLGGNLVAGGKVSDTNISNAVTEKWRSAKTHVLVLNSWPDTTPLAEIKQIKETLTNSWVPLLSSATGELHPGSYMNEGDLNEPDFQVTFYGSNYEKLKVIKQAYDPNDLFIVGAGVSSEEWDSDGLCRI